MMDDNRVFVIDLSGTLINLPPILRNPEASKNGFNECSALSLGISRFFLKF